MSAPGKSKISAPVYRTVTLLAFVLGIAALTGYLYANAGGYVPGFSKQRDYKVAFDVPTVANVVPFVDVYTAGVPVGKVDAIDRVANDKIRLTLALDDAVAPLHEGTKVQISEKSLTGQPMVRIEPGTGPNTYPSGTVLPESAVKPTVQLRDVLASLDKPTRDALGGVVRQLSTGTDGRQQDISGIMAGLSDLGRNGDTVLQSLSDQSADLEKVSRQLSSVMDAADVGQGQIAQLVSSADRLTSATAGQRPALEAAMRKLPGVLDSATAASDDISDISHALRPIARDLRDAAPDLSEALDDLPDATHDLRRAMGPLDDILDDAPPTLHRTGKFKDETHDFLPPATSVLKDLNPALRYIRPYGKEITAFFTNFGGTLHYFDPDGEISVRLKPYVGARSLRPNPIKMPSSIFIKNPYPAPGSYDKPLKPFTGEFPRIHRDN
ncbi:phospholipid/cholesterol/gamma-HCH transport system substrate-binding protein [Pseudonocardia eucalypti]|uniref:MlaD family protein n=1 Tax=Pseudonocardia eucalypti TaxID=648755 RepID=UPI00161380C2|nr:phospholipid/cholesterol/gamma-HCH transport system substrate-binding protein [Pseudonocardia eucalypti]